MAERAFIVLSPLRDEPAPDAVPIDADCGHRSWIGPTSLNTVLSPFMATKTICTDCIVRDPKLREKYIHDMTHGGIKALPGTREEMVRALGQEETDRLYALLGIHEDWL